MNIIRLSNIKYNININIYINIVINKHINIKNLDMKGLLAVPFYYLNPLSPLIIYSNFLVGSEPLLHMIWLGYFLGNSPSKPPPNRHLTWLSYSAFQTNKFSRHKNKNTQILTLIHVLKMHIRTSKTILKNPHSLLTSVSDTQ